MEPRQNLRTRSEAAFAAFLQGEELWYRAVRDFPDNRGDNACDIEAGTVVSGQQEQSGSVASSPRAGSEASSELGYSPSCASMDAAQQDDSQDAQPTGLQHCKGNLSEAINHAFFFSPASFQALSFLGKRNSWRPFFFLVRLRTQCLLHPVWKPCPRSRWEIRTSRVSWQV